MTFVLALVVAASVPDPVRQQVKWLESTLTDHVATSNQLTFPEGELFTWEFWGLALLNIAEETREKDDVDRAAREVRRLLPKLDPMLKHPPFKPMAGWALRGGVVWFGGQNLLRARLLGLVPGTEEEVQRLHRDSATLAAAFEASKTGVLEAHPGKTWPVDSLFALESLKLHDAQFGTRYFEKAWAKFARTMDATTGRSGLPASFVHLDGRVRDVPRGCALSWSAAVLPRLDAERAAKLWAAYRGSFFSCTLAPCLVREYPPGVEREGDIDSGPIVGGYGLAATGFALGAARANGDTATALKLEATGELFGAAVVDGKGKRYLGGSVPFFDVLSLYVRTVPEATTLPRRK
ncbi:MAG: hypothetical protein JNK82_40515 [Myxococcaceae bacterium]|nr:hypothetical protein [Myxococcaceae bacterium]